MGVVCDGLPVGGQVADRSQEEAIDPRPRARKRRLTRDSTVRLTDLINCVRAARYFAYRHCVAKTEMGEVDPFEKYDSNIPSRKHLNI